MRAANIKGLIICMTIPITVGTIAGICTARNIDYWYTLLNKPSFNPPNYLFGPVWTVLYILMGIGLYQIWDSTDTFARKQSLWIFAIQLVFNAAWSFIFFRFRLIGVAFVEIVVLWVLVVAMIFLFRKVDKNAAWLQLPYLVWISFAGVLNGAIYLLN